MKIVYLEHYSKFNYKDLTMALGYFDGMHKAHNILFDETLKIAKKTCTKSAILTFNMSVLDFINGSKSSHLTSFQDKVDIAMKLGFDYIIQIELTKDFIDIDYKEFLNLFLKQQRAIICGFDYTFGKNAIGNVNTLKKELENVIVIECENDNGQKIGSKRIANLINEGKLIEVNKLLNRYYKMAGTLSRRNKFYSLNTNDYYVPKSGHYNCIIKSRNLEFNINIKIKRETSNNLLIIKTIDERIENLLSNSSCSVELLFIGEDLMKNNN